MNLDGARKRFRYYAFRKTTMQDQPLQSPAR
jgi:hypothetical protein